MAAVYYDGLGKDTQRESLKRIVKAELMGEFSTLKYYDEDLSKEISYPITSVQKAVWMENTQLKENKILVKESDDFYMLMGTTPQRTCLSYINGSYKECLLSGFDSNKKTLYAYMNGRIVGRAVIRLTKGRFDNPGDNASLAFVDLETSVTRNREMEKERLVLFLERPYSAGVPDETAGLIRDMYIALMTEKAKLIGAAFVVSDSYTGISLTNFTRTLFHIYISKSKAGEQYLDSLKGSAKVSDEGGYRENRFYIHKNDIL